MTRNTRDNDDDDTPRRGGGGSGFRYQRRDPDEARKRTERNLSGIDSYLSDKCKIYKSPEGDNDIRILPATWEDAKHYGMEVFIHYDVGPDGAAYFCNEKMRGKPCPICEERGRAKQEGDDEYADKLRPNPRVLMYIIDRAKERDGVQVWSIGARMDNDIARLASDKRTGAYLDIDHPDKGYDLSFVRDGQGMKTRYTGFQIARQSTKLDNDKALQFIQDNVLIDQFIYYPYDHIKKVFSGGSSGAERDDDRPARRSTKDDDDPPKTRSRTPVEDDDPKPRRRAAPEVDLTWAEVHDLSFRKLSNLVEENKLDIDVEASRSDEELADQICEACGIDKPKARKAQTEDDDPPPRRSRASTEDDDPPPRRASRTAEDDDPPPRRSRSAGDDDAPSPRSRSRVDEDETPARRRLREAAKD